MLAKLFTPYAGVGELILRLALGISFFAHGRDKLKNPAGFAAFLRQIHVPVPLFNAWLVALLETVGALLLILGIATRVLALGLAIDMVVALETVRIGKPFGDCGQFSVRRRQFPFKNPRTGAWTVQFDQEQAYNAKALVFTRLRIVVTRKPGSRS